MKNFMPHDFKPTVEKFSFPTIYVTPLALEKMYHYVDMCKLEIGWLGTVEKIEKGFIIHDVFLLHQEVSGAETNMHTEGMKKFSRELLSKGEEGIKLWNTMRFWGHSHVNMHTSPSSQDENQMFELFDESQEYFIRGILNKNGRLQFSIYWWYKGLALHDVEWEVYVKKSTSLAEQIQKEIAEKVKEKKYQPRTVQKYVKTVTEETDMEPKPIQVTIWNGPERETDGEFDGLTEDQEAELLSFWPCS